MGRIQRELEAVWRDYSLFEIVHRLGQCIGHSRGARALSPATKRLTEFY
jgi:hypothetical protein